MNANQSTGITVHRMMISNSDKPTDISVVPIITFTLVVVVTGIIVDVIVVDSPVMTLVDSVDIGIVED